MVYITVGTERVQCNLQNLLLRSGYVAARAAAGMADAVDPSADRRCESAEEIAVPPLSPSEAAAEALLWHALGDAPIEEEQEAHAELFEAVCASFPWIATVERARTNVPFAAFYRRIPPAFCARHFDTLLNFGLAYDAPSLTLYLGFLLYSRGLPATRATLEYAYAHLKEPIRHRFFYGNTRDTATFDGGAVATRLPRSLEHLHPQAHGIAYRGFECAVLEHVGPLDAAFALHVACANNTHTVGERYWAYTLVGGCLLDPLRRVLKAAAVPLHCDPSQVLDGVAKAQPHWTRATLERLLCDHPNLVVAGPTVFHAALEARGAAWLSATPRLPRLQLYVLSTVTAWCPCDDFLAPPPDALRADAVDLAAETLRALTRGIDPTVVRTVDAGHVRIGDEVDVYHVHAASSHQVLYAQPLPHAQVMLARHAHAPKVGLWATPDCLAAAKTGVVSWWRRGTSCPADLQAAVAMGLRLAPSVWVQQLLPPRYPPVAAQTTTATPSWTQTRPLYRHSVETLVAPAVLAARGAFHGRLGTANGFVQCLQWSQTERALYAHVALDDHHAVPILKLYDRLCDCLRAMNDGSTDQARAGGAVDAGGAVGGAAAVVGSFELVVRPRTRFSTAIKLRTDADTRVWNGSTCDEPFAIETLEPHLGLMLVDVEAHVTSEQDGYLLLKQAWRMQDVMINGVPPEF